MFRVISRVLAAGPSLRRIGQRQLSRRGQRSSARGYAAVLAGLACVLGAAPWGPLQPADAAAAGHARPAAAAANQGSGLPALANLNDYPWAGLTSADGGDQWGMGYGQCVSYVAWKIYENFGGSQHPPIVPDKGWFPSDGLAKGPVRSNWGDAGNWSVSAQAAGFRVDHTPTVGSVAQWNFKSDNGQFPVGHVAFVTAVYPDGSIDLAQYNLRENSKFTTLHMPPGGATDDSTGVRFFVSWPDNFLHIGDSGMTTSFPSASRSFVSVSGSGVLEQHSFARAGSGALFHWFWSSAGGGVQVQDWGGSLPAEPAGYVDGLEQDVFGCTPAGTLARWYWSPSSGGVQYQDWGGSCAGDPGGFVYGNSQHVFACTPAGTLAHWYMPSSGGVQYQNWGGSCAGSPVAYVYDENGVLEQHVFARSSSGALDHWSWSPSGGGVQVQDWGHALAGDPSGFAYGNQQHVFACTPAGTLADWYWSPSSGGVQYQDWGGSCAGDPAGFAYDSASGVLEQHVFARSSSGALDHWTWSPSGGGVQVQDWGHAVAGDSSGFVYGISQHAFACTPAGTLAHYYWSPSSGGVQYQDWGGSCAT